MAEIEGEGELKLLIDKLNLEEGIAEVRRTNMEFEQTMFDIEKARLQEVSEYYGISKAIAVEQERRLEQQREELEVNQSLYRVALRKKNEIINMSGVAREAAQEDLDLLEKTIAKLDTIIDQKNKEYKATLAAQNAAKGMASSYSTMLGIGNKWESTVVGGLAKASLEGASLKETFDEVAASMRSTFSFANVVGSALVKTSQSALALTGVLVNMVMELDTARASIVATTQSTKNFVPIISNIRDGLQQFGIGFKQAGEAVQGLFLDFNRFSEATEVTQEKLAIFAAENVKLGISLKDTAKFLDFTVNALGMTGDMAVETSNKLNAFAQRTGLSFERVTSDFIAASGQLVVYGDDSIDIFMNLEMQAKKTGVAVSDLLTIFGRQMDTFEGSAQAAGRLNAIMGGQLFNAVELLYATEDERARIVATRLKQDGLVFNNMSKFHQLAIANALGVKDIATASKILGNITGDLTDEQRNQILAEERRAELMKNSMPIMEELKNAFYALITGIGPTVEFMRELVEQTRKGEGPLANFASIIINSAKYAEELVAVFIGLKVVSVLSAAATAFAALATAQSAAAISGKAFAIGAGAAALVLVAIGAALMFGSPSQIVMAFFGLATGFALAGAAGKIGAVGLLAGGAAIAMIGKGVFFALEGVTGLVEAMKGFSGEETANTVIVLAGVAAGIAFMGTVGAAAVIPIMGIGAALFIFGTAIQLAGAGIGQALSPLSEMLQYVNLETAAAFTIMAGGVGLLALAIGGLALSLALISSDDLRSLADTMSGLAKFTGADMSVTMERVERVLDKSIKLGDTPEGVEALKGMFDSVAASAAAMGAMGARTGAASTVVVNNAAVAAPANAAGPPIEITVRLDGEKVGEAVLEYSEYREKLSGRGF